jgi:hypothetical protein
MRIGVPIEIEDTEFRGRPAAVLRASSPFATRSWA